MEKKFNLKVDNHTSKKDLEPNEQNKSVIEKFSEWAKSKILDDLKEILSESDSTIYHIHNLLSRFNLELKIRALTKLQKELKSSFVQEHKIKNREEFLAINEEYKRYKRLVITLDAQPLLKSSPSHK